MSGVQTEWHLAELIAIEDDPFQGVAYSVGLTLDLSASEAKLAEQYVDLLYREGRMATNSGLTCQLKDDHQDCLTCPAATLDPGVSRSRLCRLGKDQSTVEHRLKDMAERRRHALNEVIVMADAASELGFIPDDLSELLTSVGL